MQETTVAQFLGTCERSRVVGFTLVAKILALSDGCDVTFYVNKLLSKLIHAERNSLSVTAYTDNKSLHDAVHSTKQTLEK